jgi:hypothetical protein
MLLMHKSIDAALLYAQVEREWQQLVADAAKGDLGPCADKVADNTHTVECTSIISVHYTT